MAYFTHGILRSRHSPKIWTEHVKWKWELSTFTAYCTHDILRSRHCPTTQLKGFVWDNWKFPRLAACSATSNQNDDPDCVEENCSTGSSFKAELEKRRMVTAWLLEVQKGWDEEQSSNYKKATDKIHCTFPNSTLALFNLKLKPKYEQSFSL